MNSLLAGPMTLLLAAVPPGDADPASGKGPEWGKAAPIGLLIILLMGVALFLLIKSMNRNLRKVPTSFDRDDQAGDGSATAGPGAQMDGGDGDPGPDAGSGEAVMSGDGDPGWPPDDDPGTDTAETTGGPGRRDERR